MGAALKVRRAGIGHVTIKKAPFAKWLDEQPRAALTYEEWIPRGDEKGWTAEDFAQEAKKRGVDGVRIQTVYKRRAGMKPRYEADHMLRKAFAGNKKTGETAIQF